LEFQSNGKMTERFDLATLGNQYETERRNCRCGACMLCEQSSANPDNALASRLPAL
jgi:hypothetical protein